MATETQTTFSFTLLIDGPDLRAENRLEALFEAGCDDATFGSRDSIQFADFDREAPSQVRAIVSAIRAIQSAVPEAVVVRVEPEDLVSMKAIADRTGFSKEYIRLLAAGERGPGGFPAVVRWVDSRTRVWHWTDVAEWVETRLGTQLDLAGDAHAIAAFNGILELRRHVSRLPLKEDRAAVAGFIREDEELRTLLGA